MIDDNVEVQNGFGGTTTTVNLVTGGSITGTLHCKTFDNSVINIVGGQLGGNIESGGNGPITMSGGEIGGKWFQHNGYADLSGGIVNGDFELSNLVDATISGGDIGGIITVGNGGGDDCILTIYGYDFSIDGTPVDYGIYVNTGEHFDGQFYTDGILTGYLANGDPIENYYKLYGDTSIVLAVPEPSTLVLFSVLVGFGVVIGLWRRCKS